ncbi:TrbG/VirB9 family P-type conjugative transfer protein [Caulobacter sp. Root655]|uniref:TrbG/VirB9 family P-type conjugative transfer protein n=1 Tax=Caulobacter sp. Root655 TaxID=1736578 RepID=UPI0009ECA509|nr:TrbG/VirB9 family P-type conjugative transfer protein [Caulobacter sp. Root655]
MTSRTRTGVTAVKRTLLALSIGSALAAPALAQQADPHIRTFAYSPDRVQRLTGFMGFQTMLEFGPDERIENVSIGDAMGWQVTPNKRANLLFLKPVDRAPATNMTVVTDRRRYVFELVVAAPRASTADAAYVVRFRYPQAAPIAVAAAPAKPAPTARNTAYSLQGAATLRPSIVFDDGVSTYFAWPEQADLPAIFVVGADGVEGLANAVVRDGYLVVDQLAPRFVLRSDKASATIANGAYGARAEKAR